MQRVIAGYELFRDAQQAVRMLERHQLSIQDVVIADQKIGTTRKSTLSDDQRTRWKERRPNFLVVMSGESDNIVRATELLRSARP